MCRGHLLLLASRQAHVIFFVMVFQWEIEKLIEKLSSAKQFVHIKKVAWKFLFLCIDAPLEWAIWIRHSKRYIVIVKNHGFLLETCELAISWTSDNAGTCWPSKQHPYYEIRYKIEVEIKILDVGWYRCISQLSDLVVSWN